MSTSPPAAGWYPDPVNEHLVRYWDGQAWTERTVMQEPVEPRRPLLGGPPVWIPLAILVVVAIALVVVNLPKVADKRTQAVKAAEYSLDSSGNSLGPARARCVVRYAHHRGVPYEHLIQGDRRMTARDHRVFDRAVEVCSDRLHRPAP